MGWTPATRIYPIVDRDLCDARGLATDSVAEACFRGGARVLQVRVKSGPSAAFLATTDRIVAAARVHGATVVINDRADIARMGLADGVHVGQEDIGPDAVRGVFPRAIIGLSTHDERQIDDALRGAADYIAVGPIYDTATKQTGYHARGLRLLRYAAGRGKPVIAIGGITLERAAEVLDAGAAAVAVISDLFAEGSVEERVRLFLHV